MTADTKTDTDRVGLRTEFLSDYGLRALSKVHERDPYRLEANGMVNEVRYWPAESMSGLFGGNSNWRGPIWMPVNYLIIPGTIFLCPLLARRWLLGVHEPPGENNPHRCVAQKGT